MSGYLRRLAVLVATASRILDDRRSLGPGEHLTDPESPTCMSGRAKSVRDLAIGGRSTWPRRKGRLAVPRSVPDPEKEPDAARRPPGEHRGDIPCWQAWGAGALKAAVGETYIILVSIILKGRRCSDVGGANERRRSRGWCSRPSAGGMDEARAKRWRVRHHQGLPRPNWRRET